MKSMKTGRFVVTSALLCLLAGISSAQQELWRVEGLAENEQLGMAVAAAGDLNGDGIADLIIGSPHDATNGSGAGKVTVVSGLDGSVLLTGFGGAPNAFAGAAVGAAGDLNNDGHADIIVGAPGDYRATVPNGAAYVVSGFDGTLLHFFFDPTGRERFGNAVSGAGDVNGDGYEDVIVGAPRRANLSGAALVYSGRNGTQLHELLGEDFLDYMGIDVSGAGDVNGDGRSDLIVGGNGGYAQVFSGADGSLAYTSRRGFPHEAYGVSVDGIGDVNDDGFSDLVIGSPGGGTTGKAYVLSGRRGDLLYLLQGDNVGEQFGADVCGAGDLNGDGIPDVLVARPLAQAGGTTVGAVRAFSMRSGGPLYNWVGGPDFEWFGRVAGAGDLNGDGFADVAIGSPYSDSVLHENAGRVSAHAGNDLFLEGDPVDPALGSLFSLAVRQNFPGRPVLLSIVELNGNPVAIPLALGSFDPNWEFHLSAVLPPGLAGISLGIRAFTRDFQGNLLDSSNVDLSL